MNMFLWMIQYSINIDYFRKIWQKILLLPKTMKKYITIQTKSVAYLLCQSSSGYKSTHISLWQLQHSRTPGHSLTHNRRPTRHTRFQVSLANVPRCSAWRFGVAGKVRAHSAIRVLSLARHSDWLGWKWRHGHTGLRRTARRAKAFRLPGTK